MSFVILPKNLQTCCLSHVKFNSTFEKKVGLHDLFWYFCAFHDSCMISNVTKMADERLLHVVITSIINKCVK